jgi:hypothetical protein
MFQLSLEEDEILKSQFVTSRFEHGGRRKSPLAFTEQGVAMLSSVLNSQQAIAVNIQIIRTFTKLREMLAENVHLRRKIEALEKKYDDKFRIVFDALRNLLETKDDEPGSIGFKT